MNEIKDLVWDINQYIISCGGSLSEWTVGLTDDPSQRKAEHQRNVSLEDWKYWPTKPLDKSSAQKIEKCFLDSGAMGGTGGDTNGTYVYVFRRLG